MAHTDIAEVRDTVKENASAAVDTVRTQAAAVGESVSAAVSAALDTVQEKVADAKGPHRGRAILLLGVVAAAGVAVAIVVSRKRSASAPTDPVAESMP